MPSQISGLRGQIWGAERRTNRQMNKQMEVPCVLQDFVLFEAAALPLIPIYNHVKQGNGYC